jgi:hypothetical protein
MSAFVNRRRGSGGWITQWLANNADIRDSRDLAAMCLCYLIVAGFGVGVFLLIFGGGK